MRRGRALGLAAGFALVAFAAGAAGANLALIESGGRGDDLGRLSPVLAVPDAPPATRRDVSVPRPETAPPERVRAVTGGERTEPAEDHGGGRDRGDGDDDD